MPKEGLHLDLPFALALLAALNSITNEDSEGALAIGELSLDGRVQPVVGTLPAALKAAESGKDLYCPETSGAEAEWVDATRVFATKSLMAIIQHLTGQAPREPAVARQITPQEAMLDMAEGADKNAQNAPWKLPRQAVIMCSRWAHLDRVNP
jgi:magnesium chelatase family protein